MSAELQATTIRQLFAMLLAVACVLASALSPLRHQEIEHSHPPAQDHGHDHGDVHCHGHDDRQVVQQPVQDPCGKAQEPCEHRHSHTLRCYSGFVCGPVVEVPRLLIVPPQREAHSPHGPDALRDGPPRAIEQPPRLAA